MSDNISLMWFRQDLRIHDNPALVEACRRGRVIPIYILDDINAGAHAMGAASRWWLHYALHDLNNSLDCKLLVFSGDPADIIQDLIATYDITGIYWNRCYEPWRIDRDTKLKEQLAIYDNLTINSNNGSLLWEPWDALKNDGTPYRVFTPFYRKGCLKKIEPREPLAAPKNINFTHATSPLTINDLSLLPKIPWDKQLEPHWNISEKGAQDLLDRFLEHGINHYKEGRNFPSKPYTSRLSPYLHQGQISPNQIWYRAKAIAPDDANLDHFLSELGWREFSYNLLYHFPELPSRNLQSKFDQFPWQDDNDALQRWQKGQTGYPIVDAGMRELWQTGIMHNRVRMIVGSFLVKNLLLHWHHGEEWFWDCLVDADLANNSASWQWIAGCGADAAPYFRIFNPITQGEKFDPDGTYTKQYVPELADLPTKYLFAPWTAPEAVLRDAGITLGDSYPEPIVDIKASRERALTAFSSLKS